MSALAQLRSTCVRSTQWRERSTRRKQAPAPKQSCFIAKNAIGGSLNSVGPQSKVTLMNSRSIFMWDGQTGDSPCARVFLQLVF